MLCFMIIFSNDFIVNILMNMTGLEYIKLKVMTYVDSEDGIGQTFSVKMFINLFFFYYFYGKEIK